MTIFDDIRKDREAGTPGPWRIKDCEEYGHRCKTFFQEVWNDETDILVTTEVTRAHNDGGKANMRRIARVPRLERIALAAGELHDRVVRAQNGWPHKPGWVEEAAAAFRAACGEGE